MPDSLLIWMLLLPVAAGLVALWSERYNAQAPRYVALGLNVVLALMVLAGWQSHSSDEAWWLDVAHAWVPSLGIQLRLSMDGLSALMVLLTAFLGAAAVLGSWKEVTRRVGLFHLHLCFMTAGVVGVFLATDLFLFFVCWELMLLPMCFLITWWGVDGTAGPGRLHAAIKMLIYGQASGLLMLVAVVALAWFHHDATGNWTFDYDTLRSANVLPEGADFWIMLGFFLAFACKLPAVPFQGWLADAHTHAPTAASVDITGLLLKTSAYGILRFCLPMFPEASREFADVAMLIGVVTVIYGGVLAYGQTHLKRLIAYTSVSHMGFILVGLYAFNAVALQGVVIMMIAGALSTAGLFLLAGQIHERVGSFDTSVMGGFWARLPLLPPVMLFFAAATLGLPGLGNFVGEFLVLMGAFKVAPVLTAVASLGMVLGAIYSLALVHRTMFGPGKGDVALAAPSVREFGLLAAFMAGLLWLGIFPQKVLDTSAPAIASVVEALSVPPAVGTAGLAPTAAEMMAVEATGAGAAEMNLSEQR
jgi:NADH-quinone oxidoreductase subunit M